MTTKLDFRQLSRALGKQFQSMTATGLFIVDVDGTAAAEELLEEESATAPLTEEGKAARAAAKAEYQRSLKESVLWKTYLASFPPGTDPIFKTETEHTCSACRRFIKRIGPLVTIKNNKLVTVWDMDIDGPYKVVADAMAALVREKYAANGIRNEFFHKEAAVGVAKTTAQFAPGTPIVSFDHFSVTLPTEIVKVGTLLGTARNLAKTGRDTFLRALTDFPLADVDTVLDLIAEKKLDCGLQFKPQLEGFRRAKAAFDECADARAKDLFVWSRRRTESGSVTGFRGSVIGSLLQDLHDGVELDAAVMRFGKKVDPRNYKHPSGIASKTQIENAKKEILEKGYMSALERRYATVDDIPVAHVLHVSRGIKKQLNIFDDLKSKVAENTKSFDRAEEMELETFVKDVLPRSTSVEVFVENGHAPNFVSVIGPADPTAKCIMKHGNPYCHVYNGDLADSIKEKVKAAGGKVDGDFRASIAWWNNDDLDLWLKQPNGFAIGFNTARYPSRAPVTGGFLDVDMNGSSGMSQDRKPVENIVYEAKAKMIPGEYVLTVHQYSQREKIDVGFTAEIEFGGKLWTFEHPKIVASNQRVMVARFNYSPTKGIEMLESLPSSGKDAPGKTIWGIQTQTFRKADLVMWSPNYWDHDRGVGNKHILFLLEGCRREDTARGFLNEFLIEELDRHRHVLQAVGVKMRTEASDRQLSGLGFSTARRGGEPFKVLVRVGGSVERTIRVVI